VFYIKINGGTNWVEALSKIRNPNIEIQKKFEYQTTKIEALNRSSIRQGLFGLFELLPFGIVSNFGFRASNFI